MRSIFLLTPIIFCQSLLFAQKTISAPSLTTKTSPDNGLKMEEEVLNAKFISDTSMQYSMNKIVLKTKSGSEKSLPDTSCVVTIPVVFHVFHPNGEQGVPLTQINYAITDLNKTFAGMDVDYANVDALFSNVKSYTKVRFKLATIDPKGNQTTGVIYYKDKQSGFGDPSFENQVASCAWDNFKYFNIYIMNDLYADNTLNNSGVCWYPSLGMSSAGVARMVYNYVYLGQGGSSYNDLEFNQTFTHECGHYLSLIHTFEGYDCNGVGDLCDDTPPVNNPGAGCHTTVCSSISNGENYLDYNTSCYKNFTVDQNARMEAALMDPSRYPLWQYDNLVATGVLDSQSNNSCVMSAPFLAYTKNKLFESDANNGMIETPPVKIYACGGAQFALNNTVLTNGIHYTITNVPPGLTASILTSSDGKSAQLMFSGSAFNHQNAASVNNINLVFTNAAFVGGSANNIQNHTENFKIEFIDEWEKVCETINLSTTTSATWSYFETAGPIPRYYGLWFYNGVFYLENYGRAITTVSVNSDNVQFQPAGTVIGASSTWRAGGNQGVLYSNNYPSLDGQTGYVGFRMQAGTDYYYGWMLISVSGSNGVTIHEYQYNEQPNEPIVAGAPCESVALLNSTSLENVLIYPNPANDHLMIQLVDHSEIKNIVVTTVDGKSVFETDFVGESVSVGVNEFAAGIYLVHFTDESRKIISTKRFVKGE